MPGLVGFFRNLESKVESSTKPIYDSASRVFNSEYAAAKKGIQSGIAAVEEDADKIAKRITSAKNWPELKLVAEYVLGDTSFSLGVCIGIVEHLGSDAAGILGLLKTLILAGLYEQAHLPWYLAGPGYPLAKGIELILGAQMKQADDQCKAMVNETWEIVKHPLDFAESMGGKIKSETIQKWNQLMQLSKKTSLASRFEEGRIVGGVLYEVVMAILLVLSVAGAAVKLAARIPALMEFVRGLGLAKDVEEAAAVGRLGEANEAERAAKEAKVSEGKVTEKASPLPGSRNLSVDPKASTHILEGDASGGGHRPGTGVPGKSEFPSGWSDEKILQKVTDVANDPNSKITTQGSTTLIEGTRDGVDIRVVERDGRIVTSYPTNVPRNP